MANPIGLSMSAKDMFFDRQAVIDRIGRDNAKRLSKAGSFIRRRARSSLKRRKTVSMPGQPPHVYSRHQFATLKNILFALDRDWESVVIGPVRFGKSQPKNSDRSTVPQLMELGGRAQVTLSKVREAKDQILDASGRYRETNGRFSTDVGGWVHGKRHNAIETRDVQAKYRKRPFMGPALEAEARAGTIGNLFVYQGG